VVKQIVLKTTNRPVEEKPLVFRNDMNSLRIASEAEKQTS
jgi:hypothetical protein